MTETEKKALALLNEFSDYEVPDLDEAQYSTAIQALCRAIGQHEAFRQEVSDAVEAAKRTYGGHRQAFDQLERFIIPKTDPLVEALLEVAVETAKTLGIKLGTYAVKQDWADRLRAAIEARGGRIVWEGE